MIKGKPFPCKRVSERFWILCSDTTVDSITFAYFSYEVIQKPVSECYGQSVIHSEINMVATLTFCQYV